MGFGIYARQLREQHREANRRYSIRQTAQRVGIDPAYLSKVERGDASPPSEALIRRLAADLGEDGDFLLALAGKIAGDVRETILQRPVLFAELIRCLSHTPDDELTALVRRARNEETLKKRRLLFRDQCLDLLGLIEGKRPSNYEHYCKYCGTGATPNRD